MTERKNRSDKKTAAGEDTPPAAAFALICLRLGRKQSFAIEDYGCSEVGSLPARV